MVEKVITKTCRLCLLQHEPGACKVQSVQERRDGRGLAHYHGYVSIPASAVANRPKVEPIPAPEPTEPVNVEPPAVEPEPVVVEPIAVTQSEASEPEVAPEPEEKLIWPLTDLPEGFEAGTVVSVNRVKGYFFIHDGVANEDIFSFCGDSQFPGCHICCLQPRTPVIFQRVFNEEKNKYQAISVNVNVKILPSKEVEVSTVTQRHQARRPCGCSFG